MKKYYTTEEVSQGVGELPPISKTTLRNARATRAICYRRFSNTCLYTIEDLENFLNRNLVEVKTA